MMKITETDRKEILGLLKKGAPVDAIQIAYDYSVADIQALNSTSKRLTAAQADTIRERAAEGATHAALAAEFGVHVNTIWRIAAGRTRPSAPVVEQKPLTTEVVAALRTRRRRGENMRTLAAEMRVDLRDAVAAVQGNPVWLDAGPWGATVGGVAPLTPAELSRLVTEWVPIPDKTSAEFGESGANNADKVRRAIASLCMRTDSPYWVRDGKIYFI